MKRIVAALLLFLAGSARAQAQGDIDTRWALPKTTFLSTATASAIMTVTNRSAQAIGLQMGKTKFDAYFSGQWNASPLCRRNCWRRFREIAPGSQAVVPIDLPSCPVYSDPCSVTAVVHYTISQGSTSHDYTTRLPTYQFVPDPTATFDVSGLNGNRAAFIATGSATEKAVPDLLLVRAAIAPFPSLPLLPNRGCNRPLLDGLVARLQSAGAAAYELECSGKGRDVVRVLVSNVLAKKQAIAAALRSEVTALRALAKSSIAPPVITPYPAIDLRPLPDRLRGTADDDARTRVQHLAAVVGAGSLGQAPQKEGRSTYGFDGHLEVPGQISDEPFPFAELPGIADLSASAPLPVSVTFFSQNLYVGYSPAFVYNDPALRRRAAEAARWFGRPNLPAMQPLATIAADRSELYVVGNASAAAALQRGLDPQFAAIDDARTNATDLANALGLRLGPESLFALYTDAGDAQQTVGVATTFSERETGHSPRTAADPDVQVVHWNDLSHAVGLPIAVPDPTTTIAEVSQATFARATNVARLQVQAAFNTGDIVDKRKETVAQLLRIGHVAGAAAPARNGGATLTFDVTLRDWSRSTVQRSLGVIVRSYAAQHPQVSFSLRLAATDCRAIVRRLSIAAIRQDRSFAQSDALRVQRRLRKLLLVSSVAADDEAACGFPEPSDAPLSYRYPTDDWDIPTALPITVTLSMVYRTF